MPAVAASDLAHLLADIRSQLEDIGLGTYRELIRIRPGIVDELGNALHAVEGARFVLARHMSRMTVRERLPFRDLELTLQSLRDNLVEALRRTV